MRGSPPVGITKRVTPTAEAAGVFYSDWPNALHSRTGRNKKPYKADRLLGLLSEFGAVQDRRKAILDPL